MSVFVVPALLALLLKMLVVFWSRESTNSRTFTLLLILLALQNLCEILGYMQFSEGNEASLLIRTYYCITLFAVYFIATYGAEIGGFKINARFTWLLALPFSISLLTLVTDRVVSGTVSIGYSLTAIQGDLYWLTRLIIIGSLFLATVILCTGYMRSKSDKTQIQCLYFLLALSPIILVSGGIMIFQTLGFQINSSLVVPLATSAFLLILLFSEKKHFITDIRCHLPFSPERRFSKDVCKVLSRYSLDEIGYNDLVNELKESALKYKYFKADGNVKVTAELMRLNRTTVHAMVRRHNLKAKT